MKKYIIWAPSLKLNSGGVTVLHLLAHYLNKLGYEAYLWPGDNNFELFMTNAKYNVSFATKDMINDEAIVIYPEIVIGNPLKAKNVVRWILNIPGRLGGDGIFGKDDILFYYSKAFTEGKKNVNYLQLIELYGGMFQNRHLDREGSCYLMGKGRGRQIIHEIKDSVEIKDSTPSEDLVRIFNDKKIFYCYDYASFLSIQAALCGCISVVIPIDGISEEEWISMSKTRTYGIAYGEENIEHAVVTMDKVRQHLESLEVDFFQSVNNFVIKTQERSRGKTDKNKSFLKIKVQKDKTIEMLMSEAEKFVEEGKLDKAKEILNEVIKEDKVNIKALNNLSIIAILKKEYDEAEKIIDKVLLQDEKNIIAKDNYEYLNEITLKL